MKMLSLVITQGILGVIGKEVPGKDLPLLNSWLVFALTIVILVIGGTAHLILAAE